MILTVAAVGIVAMAATMAEATTVTYSIETDVGGFGTQLSTDNWANTNNQWISAGFDPGSGNVFYARNNTGGDSGITRANDADFSYSIPDGTTLLSLEITARSPNFWQAGLAQGTTQRLGIGYDFGNSDQFYIFDNSTRINGTGTFTGDEVRTVRLDVDMVAQTADLILDPNGTPTLLLDDQPIATPISTIESTDGLFIRSVTAFSGPTSLRSLACQSRVPLGFWPPPRPPAAGPFCGGGSGAETRLLTTRGPKARQRQCREVF